MCTLSVISTNNGFRAMMNRDELRSRPAALSPELAKISGRRVAIPIDPHGGGTWIAANDSGVVLALLNVNPQMPATAGSISRGRIIPGIAHHQSVDEMMRATREIDARRYSPVRLVLIDQDHIGEMRWDGDRVCATIRERTDEPLMWTSSGLGDQVVDQPRRELFNSALCHPERTCNGPGRLPKDSKILREYAQNDICAAQSCFHFHSWRVRRDISVLMDRADAHTVSITTIDVGTSSAKMTYRALPFDGETKQILLPLHPSDRWNRSARSQLSLSAR